MEKTTKLKEMFDTQDKLQHQLGNMAYLYDVTFIRDMTLALVCELMEALQETPWKAWKQKQKFNANKFRQELIDAWHFLINLSLAGGYDADSLFHDFMKKNKINYQRQLEGY